jgi:predicted regulator of Ras-like GTPase activity (Roadblock/LC7/MglB family)
MSKADLLASGLEDFLSVSPDVEAAAVVSVDGLPMASALPPHLEEDRLAAMSAALLTLGDRAAIGLGRGELAQVFVEAEQGYVILMAAGPHAVLVTVTSGAAKVGLVRFEMRKTAEWVAEIMDSHVDLSVLPEEVSAATDVEAVSEIEEERPTHSEFKGVDAVESFAEPQTASPPTDPISNWH